MGSFLFIVSFSCPTFHYYFGRSLSYFYFGFVILSTKLYPISSNSWLCLLCCFPGMTRQSFPHSVCFSVCLLLSSAASHILLPHTVLNKKWKYAWSSDPPRFLHGNRSSSAEKELSTTRPLCQHMQHFVSPELQKQFSTSI